MPRRKNKRKSRRRKKFNGSTSLSVSPLGNTFKAVHRYIENGISLNPTVGGLAATQVYSANGMYDPNITGTGHQPLGFDQLGLMYYHYVVIGAKLKVTYCNTDVTYPQTVGVHIVANSTPDTDLVKLLENPNTKSLVLAPAGTSKSIGTITYNLNPNKFLNRSKPMSDSTLKGTTSANPGESCFYHVFAAPLESVNSGPVTCAVTIEYNAIWFEPKILASS